MGSADPKKEPSTLWAVLAAERRSLGAGASHTDLEGPSQPSGPLDLTGKILGEVEVLSRLGKGGMGEVWLGHHTVLDVPVAVKVLTPEMARDPQLVIRFLREAKAAARLVHPNIVRVMDSGTRKVGNAVIRVIVMELIEGESAHQLVSRATDKKLSPEVAVRIVRDTALALMHAHQKGVIHRDIKPANIMVTPQGVAKVVDFGLARIVGGERTPEDANVTRAGHVMGTPLYMAPEQAMGYEVDGRADVYSLGVSLYEFVAGRTPFVADSAFALIDAHANQSMEFPVDCFAALPTPLCDLIKGMCAKVRGERITLAEVVRRADQILGRSETELVPAMALRESSRTNLLPRHSSFVGREEDMAAAKGLLFGRLRLITVLGSGGVGKTRFVQELGLQVQSEFPGGVWFCDLTEARTLDGIHGAIADGIGLTLTAGDAFTRIRDAILLRGKCLVILDNFEQVTEHAPATVGALLKDTPEARYLVTSRELLQLEGEKSFPLSPLSTPGSMMRKKRLTESDAARLVGNLSGTPPSGILVSKTPLPSEPMAVRLFLDRARDVKPGFQPSEESLAAIADIVEHLDGIPLAIELAASRISALSPERILELMPKRFDLLTSRRRDASSRQMTLRNAIEWSWAMLQPWEQLALAQCSVFRGGFFLEAAEAIVDLSAFREAPFTMDVVESLVGKSLLQAEDSPDIPGETRYRMLESIREFSGGKMMEATPADAVGSAQPLGLLTHLTGPKASDKLRLRHAEYYVRYAESLNPLMAGDAQRRAFDRLTAETENLFAIQDGMEDRDPALSAAAILAIEPGLKARGPYHHRSARLLRAIGLAQALRDVPLMVKLCNACWSANWDSGNIELAFSFSKQGVELGRRLGANKEHQNLFIRALVNCGYSLLVEGKLEESDKLLVEGLRRAREGGHDVLLPVALGHAGALAQKRGETVKAMALYNEAETLARIHSGTEVLARLRVNIGNLYYYAGQLDRALDYYERAQEAAERVGVVGTVALAIGNRALVYGTRGESQRAAELYAMAEGMERWLGDIRGVARNIGNQGVLHGSVGDHEKAMEFASKAIELYEKASYHQGVADETGNIARSLLRIGRFMEALAETARSDSIAAKNKHVQRISLNLLTRAKALYGLDRLDEALGMADESIVASREHMHLPMVGMGLELRSSVYIRKAIAEPARAKEFLKLARVAAQTATEVWEGLSYREADGLFSSHAVLAVACHRLASALPPNDGGQAECREKAKLAKRRAMEFARQPEILAAKGDVFLQELFKWLESVK